MPTEPNEDPERFHRNLAAAANDAEVLTVDGVIHNDREIFPTVVLDADTATIIIRYAKPRLVYLAKLLFDVEDEISEVENSGISDEEESDVSPPFDKLTRKWKRRNGEIALVIASFVVDGVLHTSVCAPKWKAEFDMELTAAADEASQLHDSLEAALEVADQQEVAEKASTLAEHPSFTAGRPSFAKRKLLAEKLFPDLAEGKLAKLVGSADKIIWLKKSAVE